MKSIRIEVQSESGTGSQKAEVRVYAGNTLVARVIGSIEHKEGADGGLYACVVLKKIE